MSLILFSYLQQVFLFFIFIFDFLIQKTNYYVKNQQNCITKPFG